MSLMQPAPDWPKELERDETLLWSGQPDFTSLLVFAAVICVFGLMIAPGMFLGLVIPVGLFLAHARDAYALTNRRILALHHPLGSQPRLDSLPRAGTYAGPQMDRGPRAVWFTAPDRRKISFRFLSRATQRLLIESYPMGGPSLMQGATA